MFKLLEQHGRQGGTIETPLYGPPTSDDRSLEINIVVFTPRSMKHGTDDVLDSGSVWLAVIVEYNMFPVGHQYAAASHATRGQPGHGGRFRRRRWAGDRDSRGW
jgi:hypothetical protein